MAFYNSLKRIGLDYYFFLLLGTVALASLFPARELGAEIVSKAAYFGVALLFFIYGAKLEPRAIAAGIANWRVQGLIAACTFVLFPVCGVSLALLVGPYAGQEIATGIVFLSILPSTVQSSIAFTALARANVPAAVCAATLSNLVGVVITPLLAAWLLQSTIGGFNLDTVTNIAIQILLPFAIGQSLRRWIGTWIASHKRLTLIVDRGAILLIVYSAFSAGVVGGIWQRVGLESLALIVATNIALLALLLVVSIQFGRSIGLPREDQMAVMFCGSTKSLATGLPIANILFSGQSVGLIVLPLMLFHQLQLLTCAILAQREAQRQDQLVQATSSLTP